MSEATAQAIFFATMTAGFLAWLWALQKTLALGRQAPPTNWHMLPHEHAALASVEFGERTVRGEPEELSTALARSLANLGAGGFAPLFEITERTANRITLKKTGPLMCNQPSGMYFSEAEIALEPIGNNTTRVGYVLGFGRMLRRVKTINLAILFGIGLPALVIIGLIVWFLVIPSPAPALRWQVLQTLQIVHALWPPYLLIWAYNVGRRQAKTYLSNLLATLELAEQPR